MTPTDEELACGFLGTTFSDNDGVKTALLDRVRLARQDERRKVLAAVRECINRVDAEHSAPAVRCVLAEVEDRLSRKYPDDDQEVKA